MAYAPEHEKELPNRSYRGRMEGPRATPSGRQQAGTTAEEQQQQAEAFLAERDG